MSDNLSHIAISITPKIGLFERLSLHNKKSAQMAEFSKMVRFCCAIIGLMGILIGLVFLKN